MNALASYLQSNNLTGTPAEYERARFAGIIELGGEGKRVRPLPQSWQRGYVFTAFVPPGSD